MERVVHKSKSFEEADRWDILQQVSLTPNERQRIARQLKDRPHPNAKDVKEWHRTR